MGIIYFIKITNDISQIQISTENEFISLLNLTKKNVDFYKFSKWEMISQDESLTQIITLKLLKSNTNECYSKINFVLYKAYEILDDIYSDNDENRENRDNISNISLGLKKSMVINQVKKNKTKNNIYNLYTKDNYAFFRGIQNKINYRISYILKYIKDTLTKGVNLFIVLLPCEYQYLLLIHDLLDNINMRRLIIENIIVDDKDKNSNSGFGEFYKFEKNSELNDVENVENLEKNENDKNDEVSSFQSFSKNNSINTNISSMFCNEGKNKNILYNSYMFNEYTQPKKKRMELNIERLRKINDKTNIIKLFELFDKLEINDYEFSDN